MGIMDTIKALWYESAVYKTPKMIKVYDWRVFLMYNFLMLFIALGIFCKDIIADKGYQGTDILYGVVQAKVHGVARGSTGKVWDNWDAMPLTKEKGTVFVTTNFNLTPKQKRGVCSGSDMKSEVASAAGCAKGKPTRYGFQTGKNGQEIDGVQMCEVEAWCNTPKYALPREESVLQEVKDWTISLRIDVKFPKYDVELTTAPGPQGPTPGLNLFNVSSILKDAETSWEDVKESGAIILVNVEFDCDLDLPESECKPTFKYTRIDDSEDNSQGFNFYLARYFYDEPDYLRDLYQMFGIRLIFEVGGQGHKTDMNVAAQKFGGALGILVVAVIMVDKFLEFVYPVVFGKYKWWKHVKYDELTADKIAEMDLGNIKSARVEYDDQGNEQVKNTVVEDGERQPLAPNTTGAPYGT